MSRRVVVVVLGFVLAVVSTGCIGAITPPTGFKPLLTGLIDKGSEASYHQGVPYPVVDLTGVANNAPAFGGVVVNQTWAQLEPSPGTFDFTTLDASLAAVDTYNQHNPASPLGVRLRIFAAYAAPAWAKTLDGPVITVPANPPSNTGGTLGQWWQPKYRAAWAGLQAALAARYDNNPVLHEVAVSSCSSLTAEPFVIGGEVVPLAKADGWTPALQQACLDGAFADYTPWAHTAIYYPMNPLIGDATISDEVAQRCVASAPANGPWCILANNTLSATSGTTGSSAPVYAEMATLWQQSPSTVAIALQMNGPDPATYCAAIGIAVTDHARSVELWPANGNQAGYTGVPTQTLTTWTNALRTTGTPPTCTT